MTDLSSALAALETQWQLRLPPAFGRLYSAFEYPFINPCEFLSLEELLADDNRWRGMLPQFIPFGHDGEENYFGFYARSGRAEGDYPVLGWDHEYDHYYPVASGFESFLRWCVLCGRYQAQDLFDEDAPEFAEEDAQRREFAELVGLPAPLVTDPVPRNETELYERLLKADGQSVYALTHLGCRFMGRGEVERARDCFVRASESAPWFADPYYLLAETYRISGDASRACGLWWQVFHLPVALSTRTSSYDLGGDHPEAEIYELAADRCLQCDGSLPAGYASDPLWAMLRQGDPFSAGPHLALGRTLLARGDGEGGERELLNALTLATEEPELDAAYAELTAFYERSGRARDAALCRRDAARD